MRRNSRNRKLTPKMLRRMVLAEKTRLMRETSDPIEAGIDEPEDVDAEEKDADEQADTLAKDLDHIKALKIEETKLRRHYRRIQEVKKALKKRILKRI
jgi:hypothetical protein